MSNKMKISIISLSCCNPALATYDQQYLSRIRQALEVVRVQANVELVSGVDVFFGSKPGYASKLLPLVNKYGMSVAPALFINEDLMLYGGVPTVKKLVEVIERNSKRSDT